jgi:hypothetical protein
MTEKSEPTRALRDGLEWLTRAVVRGHDVGPVLRSTESASPSPLHRQLEGRAEADGPQAALSAELRTVDTGVDHHRPAIGLTHRLSIAS